MLVRREVYQTWPGPYLVSAHTHAVLVGFVMFMILGVALWLFPRAAKEDTRYNPKLTETAYWLLFLGTAGRCVLEILRGTGGGPELAWPIVATGALQILGLGVYFWTMWGRIRPVGSHLREAKGERF